MIHFRSSQDGTVHSVVFSPRPGTSRGAKELERQLVYGYFCPFCRNPVLFAFLTPEKISLRKYEESWVVNNAQHIRRVIPSDNSDHETAYHVDWTPIPGRTMSLQRVRMKNHVLSEDVVGNKDAAHEGGTRCCPYVGVFSLRRDLLIRDTIVMGGFPARELGRYNLPSWNQFEQIIRQDMHHFLRNGVGPTPLVMVRVDWIDDQKGIPHWREALLPYKKAKPAATTDESDEHEDTASSDSPGELEALAAEVDSPNDEDGESNDEEEEEDEEYDEQNS